jgi:hypothetical protein
MAVGGTFALVPLNNATPIRREFAVVGVEWATTSPAPSPNRQFTGFGTKNPATGPMKNPSP